MERRRTVTVEETPWWLEVNGVRAAHGTATPYRFEALAAGRLLVDGYIGRAADIQSLTVVHTPPGCVGLRARVPTERVEAAQRHRTHREQHGCGSRYFVTCDRSALPAREGWAMPPLDALPDLFRMLFRAAERHGRAGGMHAASLTDGVALIEPIPDVGRHNAVDKAIGSALLERAGLSTLGLVLTARVSAEIAVKAARAGLAWVASRSIPTDLAVEIAGIARLTIVARAAGSDAHVLGGAEPGASTHNAPPDRMDSTVSLSPSPAAAAGGASGARAEDASGEPGQAPVAPDAV